MRGSSWVVPVQLALISLLYICSVQIISQPLTLLFPELFPREKFVTASFLRLSFPFVYLWTWWSKQSLNLPHPHLSLDEFHSFCLSFTPSCTAFASHPQVYFGMIKAGGRLWDILTAYVCISSTWSSRTLLQCSLVRLSLHSCCEPSWNCEISNSERMLYGNSSVSWPRLPELKICSSGSLLVLLFLLEIV